MSITRAEVKYEVWLRLSKSASVPGFYTSERLDSVIQEAIDYATTDMMLADEGWVHKLAYFDTQANQVSLALPPDISLIAEVRYLVGNVYIPLQYDAQWGEAQWAGTSGVVQFPSRYKLIDNCLYWNPALGVGGSNYLQVEYMAYPPKIRKDTQALPNQFDRCAFWFIVYRACNLASGQLQQTVDDWVNQEQIWHNQFINMINMRTMQSVPIRDFDGF